MVINSYYIVAILLMDVGGYSINGCFMLNYHILLVAILLWLFFVILNHITNIGGHFIIYYC
jgi:hypothetical protein